MPNPTPTLNIISPKLFPDKAWNESEVLGAITWLWYQSPVHCQVDIAEMLAYVLPVLKNGQFALFSMGAQPIGYISWAYFDEVAEVHYLQSDHYLRNNSDWNCGDNIWIIQWFAPLGHSHQMRYCCPKCDYRTWLYHSPHFGGTAGFEQRLTDANRFSRLPEKH
ncbi:toxin-activating lysine-acyltransferase [Neisseria sp. ZJ106]|uniref:RTX toxin-activating lysine-acyltransferase n=1 Tax=Neisseria lisongii TaxID=2912188 RepID=A0ABY7RJ01_9NEIS|nr:toxin-activating lysine-acyltransferase [Neisseria lisongii]MCF7520809.1 toxin-activating lysine-acyltransferase [Neisseria lisongii]WCL70746.1 toxin-activating lysine-acyltransferase [Neisseria lisongii]